MSGAALVWCPFPDTESARAAADALLDDRLIACANILPGIESRFVWDGARAVGNEVGVLFKTTSERLEDVVERLGELHPYDTPAVIGWHADASYPATLGWLMGSIPE
ncbi:divalent-cation tolerance protein CutA [Porphyrobacter sp. YT40]|nr:divalent-cation tolerance protein CutA [Porphyrobacter sp. YT40]QDH36037.1 divalent-cation tolerance protein CutA [Porphyrobacter sp. YT40]